MWCYYKKHPVHDVTEANVITIRRIKSSVQLSLYFFVLHLKNGINLSIVLIGSRNHCHTNTLKELRALKLEHCRRQPLSPTSKLRHYVTMCNQTQCFLPGGKQRLFRIRNLSHKLYRFRFVTSLSFISKAKRLFTFWRM